jgi:DNA-nicking Smr family endonuclease
MSGKKGGPTDTPPKKGGNLRELSHEDRHLWDFVTKTIKPLQDSLLSRGGMASSVQTPPNPPEKPKKEPVSGSWLPEFRLKPPPEPAAANESKGLDRRTSERLRRGQLPIEAVLDLHGLRQAEAQQQLSRFLLHHHQAGRRCVLVITGKGGRRGQKEDDGLGLGDPGGVLRRMLPLWLDMNPLRPLILDHAAAKPKDGGAGAFYILLRRQR